MLEKVVLPENRVRGRRLVAGWSQAELASRAGISRAAVSAIEMERLDPSVTSALAIATALGCQVEELFGATAPCAEDRQWAWPPVSETGRYWRAQVGQQVWHYAIDISSSSANAHDGVYQDHRPTPGDAGSALSTLVLATCDPTTHLLASQLRRDADVRLLAFTRSSREALQLLAEGKVHAAGIHLASAAHAERNADAVRELLGSAYTLVRVALWEEGLVTPQSLGVKSTRSAVAAKLRWIGRQPGSGAQQCLDEILGDRRAPRQRAQDHRGVVEALRNGWADAGVTLRILGEEAGLRFLSVRREAYDLCFPQSFANDRRILALLRVLRSAEFRRKLGECSGYDTATTGEIVDV